MKKTKTLQFIFALILGSVLLPYGIGFAVYGIEHENGIFGFGGILCTIIALKILGWCGKQ